MKKGGFVIYFNKKVLASKIVTCTWEGGGWVQKDFFMGGGWVQKDFFMGGGWVQKDFFMGGGQKSIKEYIKNLFISVILNVGTATQWGCCRKPELW